MDSDDIVPENRCEMQLTAFKNKLSLVVVGVAVKEFEGITDDVVTFKNMFCNLFVREQCNA